MVFPESKYSKTILEELVTFSHPEFQESHLISIHWFAHWPQLPLCSFFIKARWGSQRTVLPRCTFHHCFWRWKILTKFDQVAWNTIVIQIKKFNRKIKQLTVACISCSYFYQHTRKISYCLSLISKARTQERKAFVSGGLVSSWLFLEREAIVF